MTETGQAEQPGVASVNGKPVSSQEATQAAAALLAGSRSAVVAGMGTDIAGARASVALARAIGASIDHMDAEAVFRNLDVMRRSGWIVTTPLQTRARADTVLLVGDGLREACPDLVEQLSLEVAPTLAGEDSSVVSRTAQAGDRPLAEPDKSKSEVTGPTGAGPVVTDGGYGPAPRVAGAARHLFHLCPGARPTLAGATAVSGLVGGVLPTLAALRALAAGRATSLDEASAAPLRHLAVALIQARFGVAIWSAAALETLAIEMLCGLIEDLNKQTRFAGLPLVPPNGAEGVTQAVAWASGLPVRTGFTGLAPVHDPWRFDAQRLVASGEADAAMWISAFSPTPPPWDGAVPTIALIPPGTSFRTPPSVAFEVGYPGRDHDAMLFDPVLGGIAFAAASAPRTVASVADTVGAITTALASC